MALRQHLKPSEHSINQDGLFEKSRPFLSSMTSRLVPYLFPMVLLADIIPRPLSDRARLVNW